MKDTINKDQVLEILKEAGIGSESNDTQKAIDEAVAIVIKEQTKIDNAKTITPDELDAKDAARLEVKEPDFKYKHLGEQLQDVAAAAKDSTLAKKRLHNAELDVDSFKSKGMTEGIPADGGYAVQNDFTTELMETTFDTGVLVPLCETIEIGANSNGLVSTYIDEKSRKDGHRAGGVLAYWVAEEGSYTETQLKLREEEMKLVKLGAIVPASDELLQDSTALRSLVMIEFPKEINFKIDDAIVRGKGGYQPLGLINGNGAVTVAKEGSQTADTVVRENISKMWNRLLPRNRANARWLINLDVETQLEQLVLEIGTGGVPVYLPPGGLTTTGFASLYGRPVMPVEQCSELGNVGDIILTDLSDYRLIRKGGIDMANSVHVYFTTDKNLFKFRTRINGQPKSHNPITAAQGTTTRSSTVLLAARA